MKRLTAYVSGKVQKAGYRARVMKIARDLGLKGLVQNLDDGRTWITAEGEDDRLEQFLKAIDIKNTIIRVDSISKDYSEATGEYRGFCKIVDEGETDSRLDLASSELNKVVGGLDKVVAGLNDVVGAIKDMHTDLGCKIDNMHTDLGCRIDGLGCKIDDMHTDLGCKIDDNRVDIVGEVRELRKDIKEGELIQMKNDIAEIKIKLKLES
jgi:acylphosphatase